MASRFAILHHKTAGGEHWDLMLERGGVLLTWQLEREPVWELGGRVPLAATVASPLVGDESDTPPTKGDATTVAPACPSTLPIRAARIADHRLTYLKYEGPLTRNRGEVIRVDAGSLAIESITDDQVVFSLTGNRLWGRFALTRTDPAMNRWTFTLC